MDGILKTSRLAPVSRKRRAENRLRKKVTDQMEPICVRCGKRADDAHEIVSRARGGSITDPANLVALCRLCHDFITCNPLIAEREGLSKKC